MRCAIAILVLAACAPGGAQAGTLRASAHAVDITPRAFPIITSGGFLAAKAERAEGTLHARAIALDDGAVRLVISVVDTLMMPRELLDRVKVAASRSTGIPPERMLISATHTHSAPAVMGALGTDADPEYARFLEQQVVEAISGAGRNLAPARSAWAVVDDLAHTHCRRWIRRPDRLARTPSAGSPDGPTCTRGIRTRTRSAPPGPSIPGSPACGATPRRAADRRPGELLDALLRRTAGGVGGLLRAGSPPSFGWPDRRRAGRSSP